MNTRTPLQNFVRKIVEKPKLVPVAVVLCALHTLFFAGGMFSGKGDDLFLYNDTIQYVQLASHAVTDGTFSLNGEVPSVRREPGYSTYLMAFMKLGLIKPHVISASNLWPALLLQILLYGFASFLVAKGATRMFTPFIGLLTLLFLNLYWPIFYYQYTAVSEGLAYAFLAITWSLMAGWKMSPSFRAVAGTALVLGLACVVKSALIPFILVLSGFIWLRKKLTFPKAVVFGLVAMLFPLLWTVRNYQVTGLPILGSIDGVSSLYRGNVLPFTQIPSPEDPQMPAEAVAELSEMTQDGEKYKWYKENALEIMKAEPLRYSLQVMNRAVLMVTDFDLSEKPPLYRYVMLIKNDWFLTMLIFALAIPALLRFRNFWIESALLLCLYSIGIYSVIYGLPRYLVPALFVMAPGIAFAFGHLIFLPLLKKTGLLETEIPETDSEPGLAGTSLAATGSSAQTHV